MAKFLVLARKEASTILLSPSIFFATAFFVLLDSFAFYLTTVNHTTAYALFDEMALFMLFTSIIMYPLISMHAFSEENAGGTLETLLTAPISHFTAVMAKYAGAMVFVALYLLHGVVYAVLLAMGGELDWNSTLTAFLALFAVGSLAMSLGVFVSTLTMSPVAAAAGSAGILFFIAITSDIDPYTGSIPDILNSLSFIPHAKRWIAGELDTRGMVYFVSATALFLFYAWLSVRSRGAERRVPNKTVRRRLTVTYFLVLAAIVCLIAQAAVLHIRGFWESGTPFGPHLDRLPRYLLAPLAAAILLFLWSLLTYRAARRAERSGSATRQIKYQTISESKVMGATRLYYEDDIKERRRLWLAAIAGLVIALNLNWLAHYPFRTFSDSGTWNFLTVFQDRRWDVSEDGRNSLSPTTRRTLDSLQGRLQIYSFLSEEADIRDVPVAEEMRRLLARYNDYSALVSSTFADAAREPDMARELARELDIPPEGLEKMLVLDYQGRRLTIPAVALVAPPQWRAQMAGETRWVFDGENRLTQTVMRLVDPRVPNVFFVYGHLEHSPVAGPYPERSVSRFARVLAAANMRVRQHIISPGTSIPPECDILVIASPRVQYQPHEVREIERYMEEGGRLLLFAPVAGKPYPAADDPLNQFAFELGGGYRDDMVEDREHNDNGQILAPVGEAKGVGEGSIAFVFPVTRTIRDNPRSVEKGWASERMIETYPSAVSVDAETEQKRAGPFTMLYRSFKTTESREARAVVAASGRMAADSDIGRGANEALLMGMVQWLAGREESRDIEPRAWIDRRLVLTGPQFRAMLWIGVVLLPLMWLMTGVTVWWMRRE